ncbi:hypothetical protein [Ornithinimicrobium kibberense]|uniref:hypothetical protein n=1 Tax=Ornithinimicrobium kibberense TaxID=282060 RepID=UPI00360C4529
MRLRAPRAPTRSRSCVSASANCSATSTGPTSSTGRTFRPCGAYWLSRVHPRRAVPTGWTSARRAGSGLPGRTASLTSSRGWGPTADGASGGVESAAPPCCPPGGHQVDGLLVLSR